MSIMTSVHGRVVARPSSAATDREGGRIRGADAASKLDNRRSTYHSSLAGFPNNPIDAESGRSDLQYGGTARYHHELAPTATDATSFCYPAIAKAHLG